MRHWTGPWTLVGLALFLAASVSSEAAFAQLGSTRVDQFRLQPGFKIELIYEVPFQEQGSWVAMCVDLQGRLIVSDQYGKLYRIDLPQTQDRGPLDVSKMKVREFLKTFWKRSGILFLLPRKRVMVLVCIPLSIL